MRVRNGLLLLMAFAPAALSLIAGWSSRWCVLTPPLAFAAGLVAFPRARPARRPLVSPHNVLVAGFAVQLVLAPLLFLVDGPVLWVFPVEQTWGAIAQGALLIGLSFPCWAIGVTLLDRSAWALPAPSGWGRLPGRMIIVFITAGLAGLVLLMMQSGGEYPVTGGAGGAVQVARLLLRPFLAAAGVALLSNALLREPRRLGAPLLLSVALIVLSFGSVDWRRAPLLATAIGMVAALSLLRDRPGPRGLAGLAVAGAAAFFAIRVLRSPDVPFGALFNGDGADESLLSGINTEMQSYAGGVQMVAFLLDHLDATGHRLHGLGQVYAAAAPLPSLGASFRDSTPIALYNGLFLNRTDQVLPLAGQFYLDFGPVAVAVGFALLGALSQLLQRAFLRSATLLEAFVWATPAAWLAFALGSGTAGFYQSLIYFSLPSVVLLAFVALRRRPLRHDSPGAGSAG